MVLVCSLAVPQAIPAAEKSVPERLAAHYYAKLREGDTAAVAKYIDVEELVDFKQKLIPILDAGFLADLSPEVLQVFAKGDDLAPVKEYSPEKLFSRFLDIVCLQPYIQNFLGQSTTRIIGSVGENTDKGKTVHVLVRNVPDGENGTEAPLTVLSARLLDGKWRLLIPQDIAQAVEMLHAQVMAQSGPAGGSQALVGGGPKGAYKKVIGMLSTGKQREAEGALEMLVGAFPNDQPLAFAQAVCSRSRWAKGRAAWQFSRVSEMDPSSVEGKCSRYMLKLDARKMVEDNMNGLRLLIQQNPDDPLLLWLMGMVCQDNYKHTHKKTFAKEGERSYRALLELFDVGPVLLHQTFANILAEQLDLDDEALKHRKIAVELEPASWTYQGLANTLSAMKRYDEANVAYEKLMEFDANSARYWQNWANSLSYEGNLVECIEKCRKAIGVDDGYYKAYNTWGYALERQGKADEAVAVFKKAIAVNPAHPYAYGAIARILKKKGDTAGAEEYLKRRKELPGQ